MSQTKRYLGLDIGEVRIGVAMADGTIRIAVAYDTIAMNEDTFRQDIALLVTQHDIDIIVIGYPRNQAGEPTAQTKYVEEKAASLQDLDTQVIFQDESLTSVIAEERLKSRGDAFTKEAVDAEAACIILQDYLETRV